MNSLTLEDLLDLIKGYKEEEQLMIKLAYNYAEQLHEGQKRESNEPYIIHPLNVAYILASLHTDADTICAGLLHDTLEDTPATKEDITEIFNEDVANLVDGVTKISKLNFSSQQELYLANTRKIITSLRNDVRIIVIKLADRLHNMRTLQFKKPAKQKENAYETMEVFVPLAYTIGAYNIKNELEDLAFSYLKPNTFNIIKERKETLEKESEACLNEMCAKIKKILDERCIPNEIKSRTKHIYGIYKKLRSGHRYHDIHDLLALKVMVDKVENCYQALYLIHHEYPPYNEKFKDYICNPKTNMYQSLHTTVFAPDDYLVQTQIRTFEMENVATNGLVSYWKPFENGVKKDLSHNHQFLRTLTQLDDSYTNNRDFVSKVKSELLSETITVFTTKGDPIELPKGSTAIDFAYKIHTDVGNYMVGAIVNDRTVPVNYQLSNMDRVRVLTNEEILVNRNDWEHFVKTSYAKKKIREYNRRK